MNKFDESNQIKFYRVKESYMDYIRISDEKIPLKDSRPYIGIVLKINHFLYFAPLSSPKKKHKTMKNNLDFLKIDSGELGVININNMIPVPQEELISIDFDKLEIKSKTLFLKQYLWCKVNNTKIKKNATKLYQIILNQKEKSHFYKRCCNFEKLEKKCLEYQSKTNK